MFLKFIAKEVEKVGRDMSIKRQLLYKHTIHVYYLVDNSLWILGCLLNFLHRSPHYFLNISEDSISQCFQMETSY